MSRSSGPTSLTVLVLSRAGSEAIAPVVARLDRALGDVEAEILVVDRDVRSAPARPVLSAQVRHRRTVTEAPRETVPAAPRRTVTEAPWRSRPSRARPVVLNGRATRRSVRYRLSEYVARAGPAFTRVAGFALAGVTGLLVNSFALWAFVDVLHITLLLAATMATQVSTIWNFLLIDTYVYSGRKGRSGWTRFLGFAVVNNVVLLLRLPLLAWFVHSLGLGYLWANLLTLLIAFTARYLISDRYLFSTRSPHDAHA